MEGIGSPLSARPGIEIASEDRGREMSRRRQRDMSLSAISRRIAEQDAERMREEKGAKVVTNNRGADK
jgi:tRNA(Ile2) C34 agmatinyltransferase TiaS